MYRCQMFAHHRGTQELRYEGKHGFTGFGEYRRETRHYGRCPSRTQVNGCRSQMMHPILTLLMKFDLLLVWGAK